ncbi:MAG: PA2928 family protein, partial [Thermomonas sp.]
FALLGVDGKTLWLTVDGPLGVSLADGSVVADGTRIDVKNPAMAGKRVDELGYVAFGKHGLQVTLNDASQWRIDASDLGAAPRDISVRDPQGIVPPAAYARGASSTFLTRALPLGDRWLGLLTDQEADLYRHKPVIPGRDPNDRPGAMQQFLEANHVPAPLQHPQPQSYRLWGAHVTQVSAAPPGWSSSLPDNWGKRPEFSHYEPLPESPPFLRAGLLRENSQQEQAMWFRQPDSVLVLHSDKLGQEGRLQLSRISGPVGKPVWSIALPMDELQSVMRKNETLLLLGSEPPPAGADKKTVEQGAHLQVVRVDVPSGKVNALDLTEESLKPLLE